MKKLSGLIFMTIASFELAIANPETKQNEKEDAPYHQTIESDAVRITKGIAALTGVAGCLAVAITASNWLFPSQNTNINRFWFKPYNAIAERLNKAGLTGKHVFGKDDSKMITAVSLIIASIALSPVLSHYGWNKKLSPSKPKGKKDKA